MANKFSLNYRTIGIILISVHIRIAVYQADVFGEVWPRLKNSRPGIGGSDWRVTRHQEQVWKHPQTGHCAHQSFSKHGADTAGFRWHLHWPQSEVARIAGTVLLQFSCVTWRTSVNARVCLQDEFGYNAETQKLLCKNGEALLGAINFFVASVNTLVNKTMEDTLMTIKLYENARWENLTFQIVKT